MPEIKRQYLAILGGLLFLIVGVALFAPDTVVEAFETVWAAESHSF